jgi:hypothetical protein
VSAPSCQLKAATQSIVDVSWCWLCDVVNLTLRAQRGIELAC